MVHIEIPTADASASSTAQLGLDTSVALLKAAGLSTIQPSATAPPQALLVFSDAAAAAAAAAGIPATTGIADRGALPAIQAREKLKTKDAGRLRPQRQLAYQ
jgi:hypothetical protein